MSKDTNTDTNTDTDTSKFRLKTKKLLLTYKTHIDKISMFNFLNEKRIITKISICHEKGDSACEYDHTHVVVMFKKPLDTKNQRFLDYENIHPNIATLKTNKDFERSVLYTEKEDENVYQEGIVKNIVTKVTNHETLYEALEDNLRMDGTGRILNVNEVTQLYKMKGEIENNIRMDIYKNELLALKLRDYQQEWYDKLQEQNDRQILWIYDQIGNTGKSLFIKILCTKHNTFMMTNKANDNAFRYNYEKYIILDISRDKQEYVSYGAIEQMKNGLVATGKYEGAQKLFPNPKIIVMANFAPETDKLSEDRWDIYEIRDGHNIKRSPSETEE